MSEEQHLQALLDRIHSEGVTKAEAEAARIITGAEERARKIIAEAEQQAEQFQNEARQKAAAFEQRSTDAVRQAARDVVLTTGKALERHLERLLLANVSEAMTDPSLLKELVTKAIATYLESGNDEMTVYLGQRAAETVEALRTRLVAQAGSGIDVILDERIESGFRLRLDNGRIEHDFTAAAVSSAIAQRLRPQLAELLQGDSK